jgi:DNA-binding CsgD family transcriptional regulator
MLLATAAAGTWVTRRIQRAVVDNTAAAAALYLESVVSPLSQELAENDVLSEPAQRALMEIFSNTAFGDRIVAFKIWKRDGLIAYASDPAIINTRQPLAARILHAMQAPRPPVKRDPIDELSKREEDVLRRVATGMTNRQVDEELGISEKTVKHYMTSILEKLDARNRVEAALIAREAWDDR